MTRDPGPNDRRQSRAVLLEKALESGAVAFSQPLLDALEAVAPDRLDEVRGSIRGEQGAVYEFERKLGRGGTATVYLARDPKHERLIAIKVLHEELSARVGAERFVREIRLTARLQHPHVLGLLDSGVFDGDAGPLAGRPYYVMPYVDGESLRARLAHGALSLPDAIRVLREVADALCYAHEQGVVHRDVKPENILLTRGHAVVADFGIAKAIEVVPSGDDGAEGRAPIAATQSSTSAGTSGYMAPEQADVGAQLDHRADLYAWGVVAYESLTGRHPFADRTSAADLLSARVREAPPSIRDVAPNVPPALASLVMRCLANAPTERPGSAAEIVATLDSVVIDKPREAAPLRAAPRRSRRIAGAALGILLVLAAGIIYTVWSRRAADGRQTRVVGTGNPAIDVAAVQAAVDRGGIVVLEGTFSFRQPPTKPIAGIFASAQHPNPRAAQVLVSKAVTISGVADARGTLTTIDGGAFPLYVDAPGAHVTIRGLRFVRPIRAAILVHTVHGLEIASNRIEGVEPFGGVAEGVNINTSGNLPQPGGLANPEGVSGNLSIRFNVIDVTGAAPGESALGIVVLSVGQSPNAEVTLDIVGNTIRNTTSTAINIRRVNGRVRVLGNGMTTSSAPAPNGSEVVRLVNTGAYLMSDNTITCSWVDGVGIAVFSQFGEWPMQGAIIEGNRVNMLPPPGSAPGDSSAAIEVRGYARSDVVRYNTIRGSGRTALGVDVFRGGVPEDIAFIDNHVDDFHASLASAVVGRGVLRTRLVRPGTVVDHGEGTRIER